MSDNRYSFIINSTHPCLAGHFPNNPIVPGAVILEQVMLKWALFSTQKIQQFDFSKFTQRLLADTPCIVSFIPLEPKNKLTKAEFIVKTTDDITICKGRFVYGT